MVKERDNFMLIADEVRQITEGDDAPIAKTGKSASAIVDEPEQSARKQGVQSEMNEPRKMPMKPKFALKPAKKAAKKNNFVQGKDDNLFLPSLAGVGASGVRATSSRVTNNAKGSMTGLDDLVDAAAGKEVINWTEEGAEERSLE